MERIYFSTPSTDSGWFQLFKVSGNEHYYTTGISITIEEYLNNLVFHRTKRETQVQDYLDVSDIEINGTSTEHLEKVKFKYPEVFI